MAVQALLSQFSTTPLFNTKAVSQETGVPADTFRAWERRYGVPQPQRTEGGHRLYSQRDIALIRWLRDRTAEGMTISQAIALMDSDGESKLSWVPTALESEPRSCERIVGQFVVALIDFDGPRAEQLLGEAFALYPIEDVFLHVVQPAMIEIGEQWHQGKLSIAAEHFATQFVRRKLSSLYNTYTISQGRGLLVVGCAPGEQHDLGALLLSVFLVRHGWQVVYLGPDVPLADLLDTVRRLQPDMVCVAASTIETATLLIDVGHAVQELPSYPKFAYGGRAFNLNQSLCEQMPGVFLGDNARDAVETVNTILGSATR